MTSIPYWIPSGATTSATAATTLISPPSLESLKSDVSKGRHRGVGCLKLTDFHPNGKSHSVNDCGVIIQELLPFFCRGPTREHTVDLGLKIDIGRFKGCWR